MLTSEMKTFFQDQCALCSLKFGTSDDRLTTIQLKLSVYEDFLSEELDSKSAISNMDAISYIYGVSANYLAKKFISYYKSAFEDEQRLTDKDDTDVGKSMEIAVCKRCSTLIAYTYNIQKQYNNILNNSNSLICNTLGTAFWKESHENAKQFFKNPPNVKSERVDENDFSDNFDNDREVEIEQGQIKTEYICDTEMGEECYKEHFSDVGNPAKKRKKRKSLARSKKGNRLKSLIVPVEKLENSSSFKRLKTSKMPNVEMSASNPASSEMVPLTQKRRSMRKSRRNHERELYHKNEIPESVTEEVKAKISGGFDDDFRLSDDYNSSEEYESSDGSYNRADSKLTHKKTKKTISGINSRKKLSNSVKKPKTENKNMGKLPSACIPTVVCSLCEKSFRLASELESHISSFHPNVNADNDVMHELVAQKQLSFQFAHMPYYCRQCNVEFNRRGGILTHNRICHEGVKKYDCKHCENCYEATGALIVHLSEVHGEIVKPESNEDIHTCLDCGHDFMTQLYFRKHQRDTGHTKSISKCSFCSVTFSDLKELRTHKRKDHKEKLEGDQSVINNSAAAKRANRKRLAVYEKLNNYPCSFCGERFESADHREQHRLTHSQDEQIFRCCQCPKTYKIEYCLNIHKLRAHYKEELRMECNRCGAVFNNNTKYRRHLSSHVEREKKDKPVCHICGNTFKAAMYLQRHIKIRHLGTETQKCQLCGYVARTSWDMKCHNKVHEKNGRLNGPNRTKIIESTIA